MDGTGHLVTIGWLYIDLSDDRNGPEKWSYSLCFAGR